MNKTPMLKAYVHRSEYRKEPPEERNTLDVWFCSKIENAAYYETRELAEFDCKLIFDRGNIQIDTPYGWKHTLKDFRVEERKPSEFVIFCEGPFVVKEEKPK
jgi:hypothetical protein